MAGVTLGKATGRRAKLGNGVTSYISYVGGYRRGGTAFPPETAHRKQRRRRRFPASQQHIGSACVAVVTLGKATGRRAKLGNGVTSYISYVAGYRRGGTAFPPETAHRQQRRRRRFPASQQRIGSACVAVVTLGSVTSYISYVACNKVGESL